MKTNKSWVSLSILLALTSPTLNSNAEDGTPTPTHDDQILITQASIPSDVAHTVLGPVQAERRGGGCSGVKEAIWPLLAVRAKALRANAVVNAQGGHRVTAFSWCAPYAS